MMTRSLVAAGLLSTAIAVKVTGSQADRADREWRQYSGNNAATKYSPLGQIDAGNVARLRVTWRRPHVDPSYRALAPDARTANLFRSTPVMVGGVLYASNGFGTPMTYMHNGTQFLVFAIGATDHAAEFVAFSVP